MSQVGVDLKSWGSHVVVVRPCMVVDHCRHVVYDCHRCCRCVELPLMLAPPFDDASLSHEAVWEVVR